MQVSHLSHSIILQQSIALLDACAKWLKANVVRIFLSATILR